MIDGKKLKKAIKTLDDKQLLQLLMILSIKTMPLFTKGFLRIANEAGYLSTLFMDIAYGLVFSDMMNIPGDKIVIGKELKNKYKKNGRALNRALTLDRDRDLDLDLDLARALNRALDLARALDLDFALDLDLVRARALDLVRALDLTSKKYMSREDSFSTDYWCNEIEMIRNGQLESINNEMEIYRAQWEIFSNTLCELGGEYWADWYKRLLENHFMLNNINELEQIIKIPQEMWEQEISVSSKYLKGILEQGGTQLNEARIIILGEKGAGKTSLARRLVDPLAPMPEKDESTEGVDISGLKLSDMAKGIEKEKNANVHIWDFAGHSVTHASHRFFLSERCLYIILCDGRAESRNNLGYWLDHVRNYGGDSKVLVLMNLVDGHTPDIAENYYKGRYSQHQCEFFKFSIKDDIGKLEDFRRRIAEIIANSPAWNQEIPLSYFKIKEKIQEEFFGNENHISQDQFNKIAREIPEDDRADLLKGLHCLGTCLWYPEIIESDYLVLNPRWITFGIYKIINWIKERGRKDALIQLSEFADIFKDEQKNYDLGAQKFMYELMQHYELAYKRLYFDGIVVPQCLPIDSPRKEELPTFPEEDSLYIEISAFKSGSTQPRLSFPPDVLPRFIVRRSEDIRNQRIWRFGTVLKKGNITALIEQEHHLIKLKVKGEEKKAFYDELLTTLVDVLREYKSFVEDKPKIECALMTLDKTGYEMVPLGQVNNITHKMIKDNEKSFYDVARGVHFSLENGIQYLIKNSSFLIFNNCNFEGDMDMRDQTNKSTTTVIGDNNKTSTKQEINTNDIDFEELKGLLETLTAKVPSDVSKKTKQQVGEIVETIEAELKQKKPKKFTIKTLLNGLNGLVRTAEFTAALAAIIQFVDKI